MDEIAPGDPPGAVGGGAGVEVYELPKDPRPLIREAEEVRIDAR